MSYNQGGNNILDWFYPYNASYSNTNTASTTNLRINNIDISNNYVGIGTNSNIPVSQLYTINYLFNLTSIGNLFELNLPVFLSGAIGTDFKIWPVNNGTVIQFLKNTTLKFNYKVTCTFAMVAGGGGGGPTNDNNAGGGGGAGEVITGNITNYTAGTTLTITIGGGGAPETPGGNTIITHTGGSGGSVTANGGGHGGRGKANSPNTNGSSSGGSGSWSNNSPTVGTATQRIIGTSGIFNTMTSYNNIGSLGNEQNNDTGGGGGGGGAHQPGNTVDNNNPGTGGDGKTLTYGSISFTVGGGGGGGGRRDNTGPSPQGAGGAGGAGGGGDGGGPSSADNGYGQSGTSNTGGGGGGAQNKPSGAEGGGGGSGTVIFYIQASGVSI
jgi:hypothetical protein